MGRMLRSLLRVPNLWRRIRRYHRRYGLANGLDIGLRLAWLKYAAARGSVLPLSLPGFPAPIYLRARTSDSATFDQVFVTEQIHTELPFKPKFIVDVGAYNGMTAIYMSRAYPSARVVAVEVESSNYAMMKRNTARYPNITPLHVGLWHRKARLRIVNPDAEHWAFFVQEASPDDRQAIDAIGVADLLEQYHEQLIDLLKIDIEGAEIEVFSNHADSWIDQVRVLVIETHDRLRRGCTRAIQEAIRGRDFMQTTQGEYTILTRRGVF